MKYIYTTILFVTVAILYGVYTHEAISLTLEEPTEVQNIVIIHEKPSIKDYARSKVGEEQWNSFNNIIQHESGWCHTRWNGQRGCPETPRDTKLSSGSSAYGLCQTMMSLYEEDLPEDFRTNPYNQIDWCIAYASERYGSPNNAWQFWQRNRWW